MTLAVWQRTLLLGKETRPTPPRESDAYRFPQHSAVVDPANTTVERQKSNNSFNATFWNFYCIG